jgi:hypothetical protein
MKFLITFVPIAPIFAQWATISSGVDNKLKVWPQDGNCYNIGSIVQNINTTKKVTLQFFKEKDCPGQAHVVGFGKGCLEKPFTFQSVRTYIYTEDNGGINGGEGDIYYTRDD